MVNILINTPLGVWLILFFLIYKGIQQIHTRPIKIYQLLILPLIFLPLSGVAIMQVRYPMCAAYAHVLGLLTGGVLGRFLWKRQPIIIWKQGKWVQKGSCLPLSLYLLIFIIRYLMNVVQHLPTDIGLTAYFSWLTGLPIGISIGLLLAMPLLREKQPF